MSARLAGLVVVFTMGCEDPHVRVELRQPCADCAPGSDAGMEEDGGADAGPMPWGTWAATLDVPSCPDGGLLEVNSLEDRLDDAGLMTSGSSLSFPEALWLARNRPGPDTITFDPQLFPAESPATIRLTGTHRLPSDLPDTCIDARNRGVIVDWGDPPSSDTLTIWGLGQGSLQVGLVLLNPPGLLVVQHSQVAGCRLGTDGRRRVAGPAAYSIRSVEATIGPGNVIANGAWMSTTVLRQNDLGFDSLTQVHLSDFFLLRCDVPLPYVLGKWVTIEDNVITTASLSLFRDGVVVMRNNRVGIDRQGRLLGASGDGVAISGYGVDAVATIGPGNVITGAPNGVGIIGLATVEITQNSIWGNTNGIAGATNVSPPVISSLDGGVASGTCATQGRVELFSDRAGQGERFLGSTQCTSTWTATVVPEPGRHLTATLTTPQRQTSPFSMPVAF